MAAAVFVLQHGEKEPHPGDPGLTGVGRAQAQLAARVLAEHSPTAVVSSPLRRARETAAPLADLVKCPLRVDPDLTERANLVADDDPVAFAQGWQASIEDRSFTPAGGRSSQMTARDMLRALTRHAVGDRVIVVVCHGGATVDLLRDLLGDLELERRAPEIIAHGLPGAAVTELDREGVGWRVGRIADVAHLPAHLRTGHRTI